MASVLSRVTCGLVLSGVGVGGVLIGVRVEQIACDRAADLCTVSMDYGVYARTQALKISEIVEHPYVPRSKRRGYTELVDRAGNRLEVAATFDEEAEARHAKIAAFLTGDAPQLRVVTGPSRLYVWFGVLMTLIGLCGFKTGWRGWR